MEPNRERPIRARLAEVQLARIEGRWSTRVRLAVLVVCGSIVVAAIEVALALVTFDAWRGIWLGP